MTSKMIWANLLVKDIKRTAEFYTKLGFTPNGENKSDQLVSFLFADNKFIIHFFRQEESQKVMWGKAADIKEGNEIMLSLSAGSKEEVDNWTKSAQEAGADILKEAGEDERGFYYSVFADPDGHKFNILWVKEGM